MKSKEETLKINMGGLSVRIPPVLLSHVHKSMDVYGKELAIGFSEFLSTNAYKNQPSDVFWFIRIGSKYYPRNHKKFSTEELFDKYIEELNNKK